MKRRKLFTLALGAGLALLGPLQAEAQEREVVRTVPDRGWLGIAFDWTPGADGPVTINAVVPESPAARAGVARGDTLVRLNGEPVRAAAVRQLSVAPGDTVRLRVRREGRERDVRVVAARRDANVIVFRRGEDVTVIDADSLRRRVAIHVDTVGAHLDSLFVRLDSMRVRLGRDRELRRLPLQMDSVLRRSLPETFPFSIELGSRALAGAEFTQMNPGLGRYFRTEEGLLTLRVAPGSPAAGAGLEAGDVVVRVNGSPVETLRDLRQAVGRAEEPTARLEVIRQGSRRELTLRWERGSMEDVRVFRTAPVPRREIL
jgi:S1-C subfamily serine protease